MNESRFLFLFSLSIAFAAIIGLFRYKDMDDRYKPFMWYVFISLLNELLVGLYLINLPRNYQVADWNLFNVFECMILLVQFYAWHRFTRFKPAFFLIAGVLAITWIAESLVFSNLSSFNYVFVIAYSFILALFSIYTVNNIVITLNRSLFNNSMFIICVSMLIYFLYTIVVFTFLLVGQDKALLRAVFSIKVYVNALVNLLYAVAVYYIPKKTRKFDFFDLIPGQDQQR